MHEVTLYVQAVRAPKLGVGVSAALLSDGQNMKGSISPYTPIPSVDLLENALVEGLRYLRRPCRVTVVCESPRALFAVGRATWTPPASERSRKATRELRRLLGQHEVAVSLPRSAKQQALLDQCQSFIRDELRLTAARGRLPSLRDEPWPSRTPQFTGAKPRRTAGPVQWPVRFSSRRPGLQRVGEFIDEVVRVLGLVE